MHLADSALREFLIDTGLVSRGQIERVVEQAEGKPLSRALIDGGVLSEDEVRRAQAHALGVPFVLLDKHDIDPEALQKLPEPLCRAHNLVAYRQDGDHIEVALLDLADLEALEPLRGHLPKLLPRLTTRASLRQALLAYQKLLKERFGERLLREINGDKQLETLLRHAVHQHATEVMLDASQEGLLVRYRLGANLHEAMRLPVAAAGVVGAARRLSGIGSRTLPQEGKFSLDLGSGLGVSVRASSMPVVGGERLLLRLLPEDSTRRGYTLEGLGLHGAAAAALRAALHARRGLVLVCGTEGSGRTTLLYTMLDLLNDPALSLASVEERPAMRLPYVAQLSPNPQEGLTMATALRALVRQEPDIVMLDAIGDRDTLALTLSLAARGALVLASIEARDVAEAVDKLRALGAADEDLRQVSCAVGVSLVRKLCDKQARDTRPLERRHLAELEGVADFARVLGHLKDEELVPRDLAWKDIGWARVNGCSECEAGYRGQTGLFEVRAGHDASPILNRFEDGLYKAAAGQTSVAEVLRLAQMEAEPE